MEDVCECALALTHAIAFASHDGLLPLSSVYNEGIAAALRRGAPLCSCCLDRRWLRQCTVDSTVDNTCALICLSCARRFPYVACRKANEIKWERMRQIDTGQSDHGQHVSGLRQSDAERFC